MAVYANKAFYYPQQMRAQTSKKKVHRALPGNASLIFRKK